MFETDGYASLNFVARKIAAISGVEFSQVSDNGVIEVVIAGINRHLREDVLEIAQRAMMPIMVGYRAPDGNVIGEKQAKNEWVEDYYKSIHVPGFATDTSEAPPEEVAAEPQGAQKLHRIRAKTRGRPVVAWRVGDDEIRAGSTIKFTKEACLQWTMGRTLTVKPGAKAKVSQLSSRRPIVFIQIGDYDGVELPVHTLGHLFSQDKPEKAKKKEESRQFTESKQSAMSSEMSRIMMAVGLGKQLGWGRPEGEDDVPENQPFNRDGWISKGDTDIQDDMVAPDDGDDEVEVPRHQKALILSRR